MCVTGRTSTPVCATADAAEMQTSPRLPTTANAVMLVACLICSPRERDCLRRRDREVHVARQCLVRDFVGDLDLQAIVAFGERRERDRLSALQLMSRREIELRRQRLRVEILRVGLVEELLGLT